MPQTRYLFSVSTFSFNPYMDHIQAGGDFYCGPASGPNNLVIYKKRSLNGQVVFHILENLYTPSNKLTFANRTKTYWIHHNLHCTSDNGPLGLVLG